MLELFNTELAKYVRDLCEHHEASHSTYGLSDDAILQRLLDGDFDFSCPHLDYEVKKLFPENIFEYGKNGELFAGNCYGTKNIKKADSDIRDSMCESISACGECWQLQYRLARKIIDNESVYWVL